jgi:hypothetical protein
MRGEAVTLITQPQILFGFHNDRCIKTPEVDLYKCYTACMDANREEFK